MAIGAECEDVLIEEKRETRHRKLEKQAVKGTVYIVAFYGMSVALRMVSRLLRRAC